MTGAIRTRDKVRALGEVYLGPTAIAHHLRMPVDTVKAQLKVIREEDDTFPRVIVRGGQGHRKVSLRSNVIDALAAEARRRGLPPGTFINLLLAIVVKDDLFEALLGDLPEFVQGRREQ